MFAFVVVVVVGVAVVLPSSRRRRRCFPLEVLPCLQLVIICNFRRPFRKALRQCDGWGYGPGLLDQAGAGLEIKFRTVDICFAG